MPDLKTGILNIHTLDAEKDINHWTYRAPGLMVWSIILVFILVMIFSPNNALEIARILGFYSLLRIFWTIAFYLVGLYKVERKQREIRSFEYPETAVHHVVIIPNYKEPVEVLSKTIACLSLAKCAPKQMTVVLAMEAKDETASQCAATLTSRFEGCFYQMLVTHHPANLPGEAPGKASNQTWAARIVKSELVDKNGLDINRIVVTTCDADSQFHPAYFDELGHQFTTTENPHNQIWQAPIQYDTNIWKVPAIFRLLTYFMNAADMSELTNPISFAMPISSYSLSLKLADDVGYWDTMVVSEDYHMFLRSMFGKRGKLKLSPIFLPTHGEIASGATFWEACANYYNQQVRHAWGCEDIAYILQQWNKNPGTPYLTKVTRMLKMFGDHIYLAFMPVIFFLGSALAVAMKGEVILTVASNYAFPPIVVLSNSLSFLSTISLWVVEHTRCEKNTGFKWVRAWAFELISWVVMPVVGSVLAFIPFLHSQTKMLFASRLSYARTPKGLDIEA